MLIRRLHLLALVAFAAAVLLPAAPARAQDRARSKEVVLALAAEPRSLLPNTIVDWTTNNQLEHMYDRLVDRDAKTYKPSPTLATG
jgi:ABC-type oligopeptide transport system substrate-binding subunit